MSQWDNAGPVPASKSQSIVGSLDGDPIPVAISGSTSSGGTTEVAVTATGALVTGNIPTKFRETFESWPSENWTEQKATGDLVFVDGNAVGASYLVISKDPFGQGTDTYVDTIASFSMPAELAVGAHMSQNPWGHDASIEFIDREFIADGAEIAISALAQTATVLTVDTVLPHGLVPGKRIGIHGCSDARYNYPSIVVASITSPTQFTVTGGPNGAFSAQPVLTNPAGAKGVVYFRPAMSLSRNGTSMHFEFPSNALGSFYTRASAGDSLPFASGSGNSLLARQATAVGSTASVALAGALPYTYSLTASNEYRLTLFADKVQWSDTPIDSLASSSNRVVRTQVVPNPAKSYFLRLKLNAQKSVTIPGARISTVSKTASTTATVTTVEPHGLETGDLVFGYGVRAFASTEFPALTTAAAVTKINNNQFTVTWGTSGTVTSTGGYIAKANAGCPVPGAVSQSIQSAVKTTLVDGQHQITLVGSASWSGVSISDFVNLYGVTDTNGVSLGVDGVWKVANVSTTTLVLVNAPAGTPVVADFALVNAAGAVIRRTDFRASYVRIFDFERQRVEMLPRPASDASSAIPTILQGTAAVSGTVSAAGTVAVDAAIGNPVTAGLRASNANISAMSASGDSVAWLGTMIGAGVVKPYCLQEAIWDLTIALTATVATDIKASAGAGLRNHVVAIQAYNNHTSANDLEIYDGAALRWKLTFKGEEGKEIFFPVGLNVSAATAIRAAATNAAGFRLNIQGYVAP
jgi:hypothetical protein